MMRGISFKRQSITDILLPLRSWWRWPVAGLLIVIATACTIGGLSAMAAGLGGLGTWEGIKAGALMGAGIDGYFLAWKALPK